MDHSLLLVALLGFLTRGVLCGELTFELPDNEKMCFYEVIDKEVSATLEFQVVMGGNYDVDMELTAPNGRMLYKDVKKQYDQYTWKADTTGVYTFCFSNEFSTFTHKVVYFDLQVGDEKPVVDNQGEHATAMTLIEASAVNLFEELNKVIDLQTHFKLREAQGRAFAEDLNERVLLWSAGVAVIIIIVGIGQILVLRSFFTNKHKTSSAT